MRTSTAVVLASIVLTAASCGFKGTGPTEGGLIANLKAIDGQALPRTVIRELPPSSAAEAASPTKASVVVTEGKLLVWPGGTDLLGHTHEGNWEVQLTTMRDGTREIVSYMTGQESTNLTEVTLTISLTNAPSDDHTYRFVSQFAK